MPKCPWEIYIFGKWNNCPHPYTTLTYEVYLDRTRHKCPRSLFVYTILIGCGLAILAVVITFGNRQILVESALNSFANIIIKLLCVTEAV